MLCIANIVFIVSGCSLCDMEIELELATKEEDEFQVIQKVMDLVRKAKELGFSIKELEMETEEHGEEEEDEEK